MIILSGNLVSTEHHQDPLPLLEGENTNALVQSEQISVGFPFMNHVCVLSTSVDNFILDVVGD